MSFLHHANRLLQYPDSSDNISGPNEINKVAGTKYIAFDNLTGLKIGGYAVTKPF